MLCSSRLHLRTVFGCIAVAAGLGTASSARATIIDLSAGPNNPNAGPSSYQNYATPNPIVETLGAGTYSVSVVGIAGGGAYDAFSINSGNNSFSDGWHYSFAPGYANNSVVTGSNYATAAQALAAYQALSPTVFTLASTTNVDFYLNDAAGPYFADDSGGVSLGLTAVPEPSTVALLGVGIVALLAFARRGTLHA